MIDRTLRRTWHVILTGFAVALVGHLAVAGQPTDYLEEQEVSPQTVQRLFDAAFLKPKLRENGSIMIVEGGVKVLVILDEEKKLISYLCLWGIKPGTPELKRLRLVNALNDELIMVRFSTHGPTTLVCDYQVSYERGIAPFAIVNNYRVFARVVKGAIATRDHDDIINSD